MGLGRHGVTDTCSGQILIPLTFIDCRRYRGAYQGLVVEEMSLEDQEVVVFHVEVRPPSSLEMKPPDDTESLQQWSVGGVMPTLRTCPASSPVLRPSVGVGEEVHCLLLHPGEDAAGGEW